MSLATNAEFAALSPPRAEQTSGFAAHRPKKASVADADDAATAPIAQATDTSLSWFEGYCRIGKMYKAKAVYVQAHCGTKDVPVTLDAQGDRLRITWDRRVEDMKRCN